MEPIIYIDFECNNVIINVINILKITIDINKTNKKSNKIEQLKEIINVNGDGYILFTWGLDLTNFKVINNFNNSDDISINITNELIELKVDVNLLNDVDWHGNDINCTLSFIGKE